MTLANDFLQAQASPGAPTTGAGSVAPKVNFRVVPATAIAAGLFYLFEQASAPVAKGLAWIIFATAFAFPAEHAGFYQGSTGNKMSPLQTLLSMTGTSVGPGQYGP